MLEIRFIFNFVRGRTELLRPVFSIYIFETTFSNTNMTNYSITKKKVITFRVAMKKI